MSRKRPTAATFASKINFAIIIIVIIIIIVVASVSLFGVWIHKKRIIIILDMMIIIIILDMIIIIVTITFIIIIVIIRGSSHYATCMPLPSDTFHHNIWGRR